MESIQMQKTTELAARACSSCKYRKRKCDKRLPKCSLCARKKWDCNFSRNPKPDLFSALTPLNTTNSPSSHPQDSDFPSVYFLDSSIFHRAKIEIPRAPNLPITPEVLSYVGSASDIRVTATRYFGSVHTWLPFISKKHFYGNLLNPLSRPRVDHLLLFYCMKLILWSPLSGGEGAKTPEYLLAKRFQLEVEVADVLSVQALQAGILIALYEICHAVYPSAYLSVGACARLGVALGVDRWGCLKGVEDWVEGEERNRIWWSVMILDRFVNIGSPHRTLATLPPKPDDPLPVDESAWDMGTFLPTIPISLSSPPSTSMCQFARLAQATNLLSFVLSSISSDAREPFQPADFREEEVMQLDRTLHALISLSEEEMRVHENRRSCAGTSMCRSALTLLHTHHLSRPCSPSTALSPSYYAHASAGLRQNADALVTYLDEMSAKGLDCANEVPPLSLPWMCQATVIQTRANSESGGSKSRGAVECFKAGLRRSGGRWLVAGAYLKILEAREVMGFWDD